ncbi:hypothetical protein LCGC14_1859110 [marine sediment metagenome]|uniref:Uncharacterized protein n=1 Tax=marine sediment metagenome TaxID=412755 RepID=A0A0F9GWF8_9ZZZZ
MDIKDTRKKIREIEDQLKSTKINMVSAEYYEKLLHIHSELWLLLYFKINQEKTYLDPPKKEK